jgi:MFS family permease
MLFFATSINYVDRQVLGLLAPTLHHSVGWAEAQYGYVVGAFQAAYAIGGPSGFLCESVHNRLRYVSAQFRRCCGRDRRDVWSRGSCLIPTEYGLGAAVLPQLHSHVCDSGGFVSSRSFAPPHYRAGLAESGRRGKRRSQLMSATVADTVFMLPACGEFKLVGRGRISL